MKVTTDKIESNGCIKCDRCRKTPLEEAPMWQIQLAQRIRFYCVNCWLRYRGLILLGRA